MLVKVVYSNNKDKELLSLIDTSIPFFIHYIDSKTINGKKEAIGLKSHWAAKLEPFVEVTGEDNFVKVFYSETGENAINQFINFINNENTSN